MLACWDAAAERESLMLSRPTVALIALTIGALSTQVAADNLTPRFFPDQSFLSNAANTCWIAQVGPNREVIVDWPCIERLDDQYRSNRSADIWGFMAHVLLAVRDGEAKAK